jgi:hypothetical protein
MTSRYVFPSQGEIPVDERIVAPESRAEILGGRLLLSPPALEGHAVPRAGLAYVLTAHCTAEYTVAIDLLTRASSRSGLRARRERLPA